MKNVSKMLAAVLAILLAIVSVGCEKEQVPVPSVAEKAAGEYMTDISSAVPMMNFTTGCGEGKVRVVAKTDSTVDVLIPAYNVKIESEMQGRPINMSYEMSETLIKDVKVAENETDGIYTLSKGEFETISGDYDIHGLSISGTIDATHVLDLSVSFRPGNMPAMLNVVTEFKSKGK